MYRLCIERHIARQRQPSHTNLVVLTEDGQVVLVAPNPSAYTELARHRAFRFTASAFGKCWNAAAYSDGRIYVRCTRGGLSLNVAVAQRPPFKLFPPQLLSTTQARVVISTGDGTPIATDRLPGIEVRAANNLFLPWSDWPLLTDPLSLTSEGFAVLTNSLNGMSTQLYYITVEH